MAIQLSEDPQMRVVILESGPDRTANPQLRDPAAYRNLAGTDLDWQLKTVLQVEHYNRELEHAVGRALGGSPAINGSVFTVPSPIEIDA